MTNWPQIAAGVAEHEYRAIVASAEVPTPRTRHPDQIYSPVGGRISDAAVEQLIEAIEAAARERGYGQAEPSGDRIQFDRVAASILKERMDISWADAGNRRLWSFISLVALPHLTMWRFGIDNKERWIPSDLTRHTWARLWWQSVVFADNDALLNQLSESDLNQLLERRSIGGDPRLVRTFAQAVVTATNDGGRRSLIRDATKRLRRLLAFIDPLALTDDQVRQLCATIVDESVRQLSVSRTS